MYVLLVHVMYLVTHEIDEIDEIVIYEMHETDDEFIVYLVLIEPLK